jgi:hypothetical protein
MAKRIYWILLILSIVSGFIFYFFKENISQDALLIIIFFLSLIFATSVHGIISHSLKPELKGGLIVYPLLMGVLFSVLLFICIFLIIPMFCPDFLNIYK